MKKIINRLFNKFGYVPFDKNRETLYQLYLEARRRQKSIEYVMDNGTHVIVATKSYYE